jgi:hypothetical protein
VPRRVSLPGADELFRTTGGMALQSTTSRQPGNGGAAGAQAGERLRPAPAQAGEEGQSQSTAGTAGGTPAQCESAAQESSSTVGLERAAAPAPTAEHPRPAADPNQPPPVPPAQRAVDGMPLPRRGPTQEHVPAPAPQQQQRRRRGAAGRRPSGRERHDEKITVYVSAEELMDLEHARLVLRGEHGLAVDRGRIVREAVAVVLADLESRGDASILVRRLRGR